MQHGAIATLGHLTAAMVEKLEESKVMDNRDKIIHLIRSSIRKLGKIQIVVVSLLVKVPRAVAQPIWLPLNYKASLEENFEFETGYLHTLGFCCVIAVSSL